MKRRRERASTSDAPPSRSHWPSNSARSWPYCTNHQGGAVTGKKLSGAHTLVKYSYHSQASVCAHGLGSVLGGSLQHAAASSRAARGTIGHSIDPHYNIVSVGCAGHHSNHTQNVRMQHTSLFSLSLCALCSSFPFCSWRREHDSHLHTTIPHLHQQQHTSTH